MGKKRGQGKKYYKANKAAKVGETIKCTYCGTPFVKKSYQQAFCCTECKDKWWNQKRRDNGYFRRYNLEHPERLERVGIDIERDADLCLGDPEWESLAQITIDKEFDYDY